MNLILLLGAFMIESSRASTEVPAPENPPIRVRLQAAIDEFEIEGQGIRIQGQSESYTFVAIPQKQSFKVQRQLVRGRSFWKVSRGERSEMFAEKFLAFTGKELRARGKLLPPQIFLAASKSETFDVVGILPLEDYIVGVIASEMPLGWPLETLKAQAVASRSYALRTMKERTRKVYHVESTILDQVFSHIGNGPDESPLVAKAKLAVRATEGMVLLSNESKPNVLKAFYHSDCGGKTIEAKSVWGAGPLTGSTVDNSCPGNPRAIWNMQFDEQALSRKLRDFLKKPDLGSLISMQLMRPRPDERVDQVLLHWENGEKSSLSSQNLRAALGFEKLKSALFAVTKTGSNYQFSGRGFGHGVGLCQWGARHLGQTGKSFEEILSHYYPKARLLEGGRSLQAQKAIESDSASRCIRDFASGELNCVSAPLAKTTGADPY